MTYDGTANLERLYASLMALRYPRVRWHLLVVENGSERDALAWFSEHAPEVRVIVPGENTGYAGGNALGMREALAAGVDYVAVVTQDTAVDPDWLWALVEVAERRPDAGAVQPKILRTDAGGRPVIHTWGNQLHFLGIGWVGGDGLPDQPLEVRSIPYASGAGALFRVRALRAVGVFDPALFMYHEDSDLSWRLRLAGWEILLAPLAVMYHDWSFERGSAKLYFIERNRLINLMTHYRLRTLAVLLPAALLFEATVLLWALRRRWLGRRLALYAYFLRPRAWRHLGQKRAEVQSIRRSTDQAVTASMTGRIDASFLRSRLLDAVLNPLLDAYWRLVRPLIRW